MLEKKWSVSNNPCITMRHKHPFHTSNKKNQLCVNNNEAHSPYTGSYLVEAEICTLSPFFKPSLARPAPMVFVNVDASS